MDSFQYFVFCVMLVAVLVAAVMYMISWLARVHKEGRLDNADVERVRQWLLYAVAEAERQCGGGTGKLKLRCVYDMFAERFPSIAGKVSFEMFTIWTENALRAVKEMAEANDAVKSYLES